MKVSLQEIKEIKKQIPLVKTIISEDFFDLNLILDKHNYKRKAFTIWDHWLDENESDLLGSNETDVVRERQSMFTKLLDLILQENTIYSWKYNRWKKDWLIYKPSSKDVFIKNSNINEMTCHGGGFNLILPEIQCVFEANFDWTGTVTYLESEQNKALFKKIESLGFFFLDYKEN